MSNLNVKLEGQDRDDYIKTRFPDQNKTSAAIENKTNIQAAIYVGTYEKYNNGSIAGKWLMLSEYEDINAFYKACKKLHKDESDPELMFQDWEYIPASMIWESGLNEEFYDLLNTVKNSHIDYEVFFEAVNEGLDYKTLEDNYYGSYDSDEDFTINYALETGFQEPNNWPNNCIDWDRASRDLMYDFVNIEGHYFSNN